MAEDSLIKRILPHSTEAERAVIGAMMMDADAVTTAAQILTDADFYQRQYGVLFEAMVSMSNQGTPVDPVTLQETLRSKDVPEELYDSDFLGGLLDAVPTSGNIRVYARMVSEKSALRRLIKANEDIANLCYLDREPLDSIMETTEKRIFSLLARKSSDDFVPIREIVLGVINKVEQASMHKGNVTGISTGFLDLDFKTSGLQNSDLILLAARPSMGKTALVLNLAQYICVRSKIPVAMFSLEMSKDQLVSRMLSMEARVDSMSLRTGNLGVNDWGPLIEAAGAVSDAPMIIDDTPGISISELRSKCRKYKLEHDIGLVIIDYLQLMSGGGRSESRQNEVAEISRSLKALARELNIPVIALSQLSRACETRPDHRPMLSDLRESGSIEQDADVVMFLYRDDYYNKDSERKNIAEIIIAKQRNGPIGTVELVWLPDFTKFANKSKG